MFVFCAAGPVIKSVVIVKKFHTVVKSISNITEIMINVLHSKSLIRLEITRRNRNRF